MSDRYQSFANSGFGQFVVKNMGLPMPLMLERFAASKPLVTGAVLLGNAANSILTTQIAKVLKNMAVDTYIGADADLAQVGSDLGLNLRAYSPDNKHIKLKTVVFDASGIRHSSELIELYRFFNPIARRLSTCARVVVVGIDPAHCTDVKQATAQRALLGFVKAIGKEFKKAVAANLIWVSDPAQSQLESALRFFATPKAAYVSGQYIVVGASNTATLDWAQPLAGKTALVTGASRGIGEAIAHVLARDGAHVICLDVPQQEADLNRVATSLNGSALGLDITAPNAGELIKQHAESHGGLDIIVHNAGVTRDKMLANMPESMWNMVININLSAEERIDEYLLTHNGLNANARIICVSSISGIAGNLGQTNYAASKAGVIGMVQAMAPILSNGVTINAVAPGFIETQMTAAIPLTIREAGRRMNSMSQGGQPVDVAETIAMFAHPASGGMNGNIVRVCGQSLIGA